MDLFQSQKQKLSNQIDKLVNKLNSGELTESQYKVVQGILERKQDALKEGRVY